MTNRQSDSLLELAHYQALAIAITKANKGSHIADKVDPSLTISSSNYSPIFDELSMAPDTSSTEKWTFPNIKRIIKRFGQNDRSCIELLSQVKKTAGNKLNLEHIELQEHPEFFKQLTKELLNACKSCLQFLSKSDSSLSDLAVGIARLQNKVEALEKKAHHRNVGAVARSLSQCVSHYQQYCFMGEISTRLKQELSNYNPYFLSIISITCSLYRNSQLMQVQQQLLEIKTFKESISTSLSILNYTQGYLFQWQTQLKQILDSLFKQSSSPYIEQLNKQITQCIEKNDDQHFNALFDFFYSGFQSKEKHLNKAHKELIQDLSHLIPFEKMLPAITSSFEMQYLKLIQATKSLAKESQELKNLAIPTPKAIIVTLKESSSELAQIWEWILNASFTHIQSGRLFFYTKLIETLCDNPYLKKADLSPSIFQLSPLLFSDATWRSIWQSLVEFQPQLCKDQCQHHSMAFKRDDSDKKDYINSIHFINHWKKLVHQKFASLPDTHWNTLFKVIDESFILQSPIIKQWIHSKSTQEQQLLSSLCQHCLERNTALALLLYILMSEKQHVHESLESMSATYTELLDNLSQSLTQLSELLRRFEQTSLYAFNRLCYELVDQIKNIELTYSSEVASHYVKRHSEQLFFVLNICIQHALSSQTSLVRLLSVHLSETELLSTLIQSKELSELLEKEKKNGPGSTRQLSYKPDTDVNKHKTASFILGLIRNTLINNKVIQRDLSSKDLPLSFDSQLDLEKLVEDVSPTLNYYLPLSTANHCLLLKQYQDEGKSKKANTLVRSLYLSSQNNKELDKTQQLLLQYYLYLCLTVSNRNNSYYQAIQFNILCDIDLKEIIKHPSDLTLLCRFMTTYHESNEATSIQFASLMDSIIKQANGESTFLEAFIPLLTHYIQENPYDNPELNKKILSHIRLCFDQLTLGLTEDRTATKHIIRSQLHHLSTLINWGLYPLHHPFSGKVLDHFMTPQNGEEQLFIQEIKELLKLEHILNKEKIELSIDDIKLISSKKALLLSLHYLLYTNNNQVLHLSKALLSKLSDNAYSALEANTQDILNTCFLCSLSADEWKQNHLFRSLLAQLIDQKELNESPFLSAKDFEKNFLIHSFHLIPLQIKELFTQALAQSRLSILAQKQLFESIVNDVLHTLLTHPELCKRSIRSKSLQELLAIYSFFEENQESILLQMTALIKSKEALPINKERFISFCDQLQGYLKQLNKQLTNNNRSELNLNSIMALNELQIKYSDTSNPIYIELQESKQILFTSYLKVFLNEKFSLTLDKAMQSLLIREFEELFVIESTKVIKQMNIINSHHIHRLIEFFQGSHLVLDVLQGSDAISRLDNQQSFSSLYLLITQYEASDALNLFYQNNFQQLLTYNEKDAFMLAYLYIQNLKNAPDTALEFKRQLKQSHSYSLNSFLKEIFEQEEDQTTLVSLIQGQANAKNINVIKALKRQLSNSEHHFIQWIQLAECTNPDLFNSCLSIEHFAEYLSDFLIMNPHITNDMHPLSAQRLLNYPIIQEYIKALHKNSEYKAFFKELHLAPIHHLIESDILPDKAFLTLIEFHFSNNRAELCLPLIQNNRDQWINCVATELLNDASLCEPELFICLLQSNQHQLEQLLKELQLIKGIDQTSTLQQIIKRINQLQNKEFYSELLQQLLGLLTMHQKEHQGPESSFPSQLMATIELNKAKELSLKEILDKLNRCGFLPNNIQSQHLITVVDALLTTQTNTELIQFSIDAAPLFASVLLHQHCASKLQQAIFYEELKEDSLNFRYIQKAIQTFTFSQSLVFLYHYVSNFLIGSKEDEFSILVEKHLNSSTKRPANHAKFKDEFYNLINRSIIRISIKDPILKIVFNQFENPNKTEHPIDSLIAYMQGAEQPFHKISNSQQLWIKQQFEDICLDNQNRQLFITLLNSYLREWHLPLFSKFIFQWEHKNSLFDVYQLFIIDQQEHTMLQQYFHLAQEKLCQKESLSKHQKQLDSLISCSFFLLNHSQNKEALLLWIKESLLPQINSKTLKTFSHFLQSNYSLNDDIVDLLLSIRDIKDETLFFELCDTIKQRPAFFNTITEFLNGNPEHVNRAKLGMEDSNWVHYFSLYSRHFIEHNNSNFFHFIECLESLNLSTKFIFVSLHKHYFTNTAIANDKDNAFIKCIKDAIYEQHHLVLKEFAIFVEECLIKENEGISWIIKELLESLRIPIHTQSKYINDTSINKILKASIKAGVLSDSGDILLDISGHNIDELQEALNLKTLSIKEETALLQLKSLIAEKEKMSQSVLTLFLTYCPRVIISEIPYKFTSELNSFSVSISSKASAIDLLLNNCQTNNQIPAALNKIVNTIRNHEPSYILLINYLKKCESSVIFALLSDPQLTSSNRESILHALCEENSHDQQSALSQIVMKEVLEFSCKKLLSSNSYDHSYAFIEVLLFYFKYHNQYFLRNCEPFFTSINKHCEINFKRIYDCKQRLETLIQEETVFNSNILSILFKTLRIENFNIFESITAFHATNYFDKDIFINWIDKLSERPQDLFQQIQTNDVYITIPETVFNNNQNFIAIKNLLLKEKLISSTNELNISRFERLMDDFKMDSESELSKSHLMSFIDNAQRVAIHNRLKASQMIVLSRAIFPMSQEHLSFINLLIQFEKSIQEQNIIELLSLKYSSIILALTYDKETSNKNNSHLHSIIKGVSLRLQSKHKAFETLSQDDVSHLIKKLQNENIIASNLTIIKETWNAIEPSKQDKILASYIDTQEELLLSSLELFHNISIILFEDKEAARMAFMNTFHNIQEHQWLLAQHLLKQIHHNKQAKEVFLNRIQQFSKTNKINSYSKAALSQFAKRLKKEPTKNVGPNQLLEKILSS